MYTIQNRPIYTGFFFKLWDNICGTLDEGACRCHQCRPKRTLEQWSKVEKPDYSVLLSPGWWFSSASTVSSAELTSSSSSEGNNTTTTGSNKVKSS